MAHAASVPARLQSCPSLQSCPPPYLPFPRCPTQAMLAIGAAMLGAQHVVGVDVDADALRVAQQNVGEYEDPLPVSHAPTGAAC